jgi:hypothetical protein
MKKIVSGFILTSFSIILYYSCNQKEAAKPKGQSAETNPAMSSPDKFAWQLFIELNQPSANNSSITLWESWALAKCVFDNPDQVPTWETVTPKILENPESLPLQQLERLNLNPKVLFDPNAPSANETRMNKPAFDFIVGNNLYNAEGLEAFYTSNKKIDLPVESREVKAVWDTISISDTGKYHYAIAKNGKYYGLVSLHIITKDVPNWFWTTFEHVDNFEKSDEFKNNKALLASKDSYGYDVDDKLSENLKKDFDKNHMASKWKNYRLRGTQTGFTDPMGKPIILANTVTEQGFMLSSSCVTCHSRATVGINPDFKPRRFNAYFRLPIFKENDQGFIGSTEPANFYKEYLGKRGDTLIQTGKPEFIQTDFMWSFFRAKRKGDTTRSCR